jgi:hypothetical protein
MGEPRAHELLLGNVVYRQAPLGHLNYYSIKLDYLINKFAKRNFASMGVPKQELGNQSKYGFYWRVKRALQLTTAH